MVSVVARCLKCLTDTAFIVNEDKLDGFIGLENSLECICGCNSRMAIIDVDRDFESRNEI